MPLARALLGGWGQVLPTCRCARGYATIHQTAGGERNRKGSVTSMLSRSTASAVSSTVPTVMGCYYRYHYGNLRRGRSRYRQREYLRVRPWVQILVGLPHSD
jgi:hypothetical protein